MTYEIKLQSGRIVTMNDDDVENACVRAADLYGETVVAWRTPRVGVYQWGRGSRIVE